MAQFNPYQPYSPYQQNNPYIQQQMQSNNINWVQGIEGAKAWQIQPNSNAIMLDSENDGVFYIKTSDNVGICKLRVFKYQEVTEQHWLNKEATGYDMPSIIAEQQHKHDKYKKKMKKMGVQIC